MEYKESGHEEAIRRLVSRTKPERTSDDFTMRLMARIEAEPEPAKSWLIRYQKWILFSAFALALFLLFFPFWTWFGIEFTPGQFILFYAIEGFRLLSGWLGNALSHLGTMGKMMYLIPVSVAMLLLVALDQAMKRPSQRTSRA